MVCKGGGAAVVGSWDWERAGGRPGWQQRSGESREMQLPDSCTPRSRTLQRRAGLRAGDSARKGAAMCAQPTLSALMGFSRTLFAPVTEKEARLPLPKAGVNVCRRRDTCSARTSREPGCSRGGSGSAGTACTEQLIAAGRRHTEAAGRNGEG